MAFERLSRFFRRKKKRPVDHAGPGDEPPPRSAEERQTVHPEVEDPPEDEKLALIEQLDDGFRQIGGVLERLDANLTQQQAVVEGVVRTMEQLPRMVEEVAAQAASNRALADSFGKQMDRKEQVQQNMIVSLQEMNQSMRDERQDHKDQLDMVVRVHRSQRRFLTFLILILGLMVTILLAITLVLALNPEFLNRFKGDTGGRTGDRQAPVEDQADPAIWSAPAADLLTGARESSNPRIRALAGEP